MSKRIFTLRIDTHQVAETLAEVQRLRSGLADRRQLHARIALTAADATRQHVRGLNRHKSAQRLGAKPTGHHANVAKQIEADSNAEAAIVRIPRNSGLGRAFGDVVIRPGSGKTFLTIPADKLTYGRRAREFPEGTFAFTVIGGRYPALVFVDGWKLAYWLRRVVTQKQDRSLLPSDKFYRTVARAETRRYVEDLLDGKGGPA